MYRAVLDAVHIVALGIKKTEVYRDFMEKTASQVNWASLLAHHVDLLLRLGLKYSTHDQHEEKLEACFKIYLLLSDDKDLFLREYEKLTAMRLINETSCNRQAEEFFLGKLSR